MASPEIGEKELAIFSVKLIREFGGVLEHPYASNMNMQDLQQDEHGGFLITIDQFDFGHVARKKTRLYICGITPDQLPALPPKRTDVPTRSIAGNVKGTKRCTQYQLEYTPDALILWMKDVCNLIEWNKKYSRIIVGNYKQEEIIYDSWSVVLNSDGSTEYRKGPAVRLSTSIASSSLGFFYENKKEQDDGTK